MKDKLVQELQEDLFGTPSDLDRADSSAEQSVEDSALSSAEDGIEPTEEGSIESSEETTVEEAETDFFEEQETDQGEAESDDSKGWEEEDFVETQEDPMNDFVYQDGEEPETPPQTTTVKDVKERLSSPRNRKNLEKLGLMAMDKVDVLKAKLCSAISGSHLSEYTSDDDMKLLIIEALKEFLESMEIKEPSPAGTLMYCVGIWALLPLGTACLERWFINPKPKTQNKQTLTNSTPEQPVEAERQTDYSHVKECQQERKIFSVNKDGFYKTNPAGTFISATESDRPSPEVQELIDKGLPNKEIRTILGYGR